MIKVLVGISGAVLLFLALRLQDKIPQMISLGGADIVSKIQENVQGKTERIKKGILGNASSVLPGIKQDEKSGEAEKEEGKREQVLGDQPIIEPAQKIESQTQTLIDAIKNLPEDQVLAIKKQIYKDFCAPLLEDVN